MSMSPLNPTLRHLGLFLTCLEACTASCNPKLLPYMCATASAATAYAVFIYY